MPKVSELDAMSDQLYDMLVGKDYELIVEVLTSTLGRVGATSGYETPKDYIETVSQKVADYFCRWLEAYDG